MKICLVNGVELAPITITGARKTVQGSQRDVLSFVFPADMGMDALDAAFTTENCEIIAVTDNDGTEHVHKGYTVRAELTKTLVEVSPATVDTAAVTEERIIVGMGQRTYMETQMAQMQAAMNALLNGEG